MPGKPSAVAVPTCALGRQPRPSNAAWLHLAAAFGLPTRPGGRSSTMLDGVDANVALIVTLAGAPAWVVDVVTVSAA